MPEDSLLQLSPHPRLILCAILLSPWCSACASPSIPAKAPIGSDACALQWSLDNAQAEERALAGDVDACALLELQAALDAAERQVDAEMDGITWVWSLGVLGGAADALVVVGYHERVVDPEQVIGWVRLAMLRIRGREITITGGLSLREPHPSAPGELYTHFLAKKDYDGDGVADIAVEFADVWEDEAYTGIAVFSTTTASVRVTPRAGSD